MNTNKNQFANSFQSSCLSKKLRFANRIVVVVVGLFATTAASNGALSIYESFETELNQPATGIGAWTGSTSGTSNPYAKISTGLTFTGLSTAGGAVKRTGVAGAAEIRSTLTSGAQTALTADNSSIWFSVLISAGNASSNANMGLMFGNAGFTDGQTLAAASTTNGFGIKLNRSNFTSTYQVGFEAFTMKNGTLTTAANINPALFYTNNLSTVYLMVGKIDWATSGSNDTLRLFNVTDTSGAAPTNGQAFTTISGNFNQSTFNTLAIGESQTGIMDEIRFGSSYADVVAVVPEPSASLLIGTLGFLGLLRRRR